MEATATYHSGFARIPYANGEVAFAGKVSVFSRTTHSTAVSEWTYYPAEERLAVTYKSSPRPYFYVGVPVSVMFGLLTAGSLGAFIAREVKPNYETI